jgi:hypothetical protein
VKITIEPTNQFVEIGAAALKAGAEFVPSRVWKGIAENGVECVVLVMAIQPQTNDPEKLAEIVGQGAPLMPVPAST